MLWTPKAAALFLLMLLFPSAALAGATRTVERIVAVVNDEAILESELAQWALPQMRTAVDLETAEGRKNWEAHKRQILDQMIDGRLMLQQATELKLSVSPDEIERALEEVKNQNKLSDATFKEALKQQGYTLESYRKTLRRQLLQMKVVSTAVRSRVSVSDDEIRAYYQQNARQIAGDRTVHLRQILLLVPSDASAEEVERKRKLASHVMELARAGRSFAELAKQYSEDEASKNDGGDSGWIGRGVLVDSIEEVVDSMDAGDLRGPIRMPRGFAVLQLVERKTADVRPLEEIKDQLRKQLYDQQVEKATQSWTRELRKKAHVDIRF